MFSKKFILLSLLLVVVLLLGCGIVIKTYDVGSLGWAKGKANTVRNAELPDGVLRSLGCRGPNTDGNLSSRTGSAWFFLYGDGRFALLVSVDREGNTESTPYYDQEAMGEILAYDDAKPWIVAANAAVLGIGITADDYEWRELFVSHDVEDEYADTDNTAWVYYAKTVGEGDDEEVEEVAEVLLDADTNAVLSVQAL